MLPAENAKDECLLNVERAKSQIRYALRQLDQVKNNFSQEKPAIDECRYAYDDLYSALASVRLARILAIRVEEER